MSESASGLRSILRPIKALVMRPRLARGMHRRKWEKKWGRRGQFDWQTAGLPPELAAAIDSGFLVPGMKVLDVGCGNGTTSAALASRGFSVLGVDFAQPAITAARQAFADTEGVSFETLDVADPRALDGRSFDALIDRGCLHGLPPGVRTAYAANVAKWARPQAPFLLTVHTGSGQPVDVREEQLTKLLGRSFTVEGHDKIEAIRQRGERKVDGAAFRLRRK